MRTEKIVQYGFCISIFLSITFFIQYTDPTGVHGLRSHRFTTSMQLYKQFGKVIDDSEPPIIGILSQGTTEKAYYDDYTMIAASYVRYIEAAGGKVVAVPFNLNETELERIYQNINGLLIPGGKTRLIVQVNKNDTSPDPEMKTSRFANAARFFVNRAMEDFTKGGYFPIFGICLGMEAIALAINQDVKRTLTFLNLTANKYQEAAGPLDKDVRTKAYKSRIFDSFTDSEMEFLERKAKFFYHHKFGVLQKTFDESEELKKHIIPLTSVADLSGNEYITSFEMYNYPIYGVQFHPEKSSFEWSIKTDRSPETLSITHKLASNFVKECRKNIHQISDAPLMRNLSVYKHVMMGPTHGYSQLFYLAKQKIRDVMDWVNETNQTEAQVQTVQIQQQNPLEIKEEPETQTSRFLGRNNGHSLMNSLQDIVSKLESIEHEHDAQLHALQDDDNDVVTPDEPKDNLLGSLFEKMNHGLDTASVKESKKEEANPVKESSGSDKGNGKKSFKKKAQKNGNEGDKIAANQENLRIAPKKQKKTINQRT